jgi:hypothetical protein
MGCQYDGRRCHGLTDCCRCNRNPYPCEPVRRYPTERRVTGYDLRRCLR